MKQPRLLPALLLALLMLLPAGCGAQTTGTPQQTPTPTETATVSGAAGTLRVLVPDGWKYELCPAGSLTVSDQAFGVKIWPDSGSDSCVQLYWSDSFGVCGTGLKEKSLTLAGDAAAAGVRGKEHCTDREGGKKRGLGYGSGLGPGFHDSFLLQKHSLMVWQEKRKPSVFPALWQKRRKAENPPRYHSSSPPKSGDALTRDTIISLHNNGRTRLHLLIVQRSHCSASSAGLYALCLAPPGTSLKGRSCLLLCVFAFDGLMITPVSGTRQSTHSPKKVE